MAELRELRVRLEGALETVERATADMLAAAQEVRAGRTAQLVAAMTQSESVATQQAFETVQRLASHEPALAPIRERFIFAREAMRAATLARGAELGLRSMSVASVAATLAEYPVLYAGRSLDARALVGGALFFVFLTGLATRVHLVFLLFPFAVALAIAAFVARSPRLVVTRGQVRLGATLISLTGVESVLLASDLMMHRELLRFRLCGGGVLEVVLPSLPAGFVRALEQVTKVEHSS